MVVKNAKMLHILKRQENLLAEYNNRFAYDFNTIERRSKTLIIFMTVAAFGLTIYTNIKFKITLSLFVILTGVISIENYIQIRKRAYDNVLQLKKISDKLGITGLVHIKKREKLIRFKSVSFYDVMFMIIVTIGWVVILLGQIFSFNIP